MWQHKRARDNAVAIRDTQVYASRTLKQVIPSRRAYIGKSVLVPNDRETWQVSSAQIVTVTDKSRVLVHRS